MSDSPTDELVLVVSDLHLGSDAELEDFYADDQFADFLRHHAREPRVHLIINGDFVDFLQSDPDGDQRVERDQGSPLWLDEAHALAALDRCAARHKVFFEALAAFIASDGKRCSILRGNHDMELAYPRIPVRLRELLGGPPPEKLDFPIDAIFDEKSGLYVEHGSQYDPVNAARDLRDPFLDRRRRKLEVPVGSVLVKVIWNRVEREFPHVDKIRPMWDSVSAVLVQRPTYLFLRFDYIMDLAWGITRAALAGFLRLVPRKGTPPDPPASDPRALGQKLARPGTIGKWTALTAFAFAVFVVVRGALLWDEPGMQEQRVVKILDSLFKHFGIGVGISIGTLIVARIVRRIMLKLPTLALIRNVLYRLLVAASAAVFFYSFVKMFWVPLALVAAGYVLLDAARTVRPSTNEDALGIPREPEVMAALRLLKHEHVHTVVFGHTHVPLQIDLPSGKRYINSGTWIRSIDLRNARSGPVELNTYVAIRGAHAELMAWRGTEPARRFGSPTPAPVLAAAG